MNYGQKEYNEKQALLKFKKFIEYSSEDADRNINVNDVFQGLLLEIREVPFPSPRNAKFDFIGLFAGCFAYRPCWAVARHWWRAVHDAWFVSRCPS